MAQHSNPLKSFAATRLPWAVALGVGMLYLLTLHSWISFASLPAVSDVGGWTGEAPFEADLLALPTLSQCGIEHHDTGLSSQCTGHLVHQHTLNIPGHLQLEFFLHIVKFDSLACDFPFQLY